MAHSHPYRRTFFLLVLIKLVFQADTDKWRVCGDDSQDGKSSPYIPATAPNAPHGKSRYSKRVSDGHHPLSASNYCGDTRQGISGTGWTAGKLGTEVGRRLLLGVKVPESSTHSDERVRALGGHQPWEPESSAVMAKMQRRLSSLAGIRSAQLVSRTGIYAVEIDEEADLLGTMSVIKGLPGVEFVERNREWNIQQDDMNSPDDPLHRSGSLWGLKTVRAESAWRETRGSKAVVVCVVDTGVDYTHPDLAGNMWRNPGETGLDGNGNDKATNGLDDDGNGFVDDVHGIDSFEMTGDPMDANGHGTHCAGTIGAVGNNTLGMVGVNQEVAIMACRFSRPDGYGTTLSLLRCLEYSLQQGAHITSNSWGGGAFAWALSWALFAAQASGQIFVAAAGNVPSSNDKDPQYPASYPHDIVTTVTATNAADQLSCTSSYGLTSVDLGAPGVGILSTIPGGLYMPLSGSSMAAPFVAGSYALLKAADPSLGAADLKSLLLSTAKPRPSLIGRTLSGAILDVGAAMSFVRGPLPKPPSFPRKAPPQPPVQLFAAGQTFDLQGHAVTYKYDPAHSIYAVCLEGGVQDYLVTPMGGEELDLSGDDGFGAISGINFTLFGNEKTALYVNANGHITFDTGDAGWSPTLADHFSRERIAPLFSDLSTDALSSVSWKALGDGTVAVTYNDVMQWKRPDLRHKFQVLLHPNGDVRFAYVLVAGLGDKLVGISGGFAVPAPPASSDLGSGGFAVMCRTGSAPPAAVNPRCCEELEAIGFDSSRGSSDSVCGASKWPSQVCTPAASLADAGRLCTSIGARLCSLEELRTGEVRGTGCRLNSRKVWTSQPCVDIWGLEGHIAGKGRDGSSSVCLNHLGTAGVRCCADACQGE